MKPGKQRLTREQVGGIVKMIELTTEREFDCGECLQHVSQFAEHELARTPVDEVIAKVDQHLELCPDCRVEYAALMKILAAKIL